MGSTTRLSFAFAAGAVLLVSAGSASAQEEPVPVIRDQPPSRQEQANNNGLDFGTNLSFELSYGLSFNRSDFRIDTGRGTFQDFRTQPFSGHLAEIRLTWHDGFELASSGDSNDTRIAGSLGIGYRFMQGHVDLFENVGGRLNGVQNTAFEGTTRTETFFVAAGLSIHNPNMWNPFGDLPGVPYFGGSVGTATVTTQDNNGPFSSTESDISYAVEAFYRFPVTDNISIAPGVYVIFNPNGQANNDAVFVGAIRTTFQF